MKCHVVEGVMGNREVPRIGIPIARADLGGASDGASRGEDAKENVA
jgi:hypothetical protein